MYIRVAKTVVQRFFCPTVTQWRDPKFSGLMLQNAIGKYVPAASYAILKRNPNKEIKINLKDVDTDSATSICALGIAIGNGLCDPAHMMLYGDHLYQMGLIDVNAREHFYQVEHLIRQRISEQDWESAMEIVTDIQTSNVMVIFEIPLKNTAHTQVKVKLHRFLNVCKGVVTCYDLDCVSIEEICEELFRQNVTEVYRIVTKKNGQDKNTDE
uniref:Uncharacterized protein n=1 Tax=Timema bartmani TaxID=61472 RepID=A0A7R9I582_9NEOP|nr:unnamed protein product [Timema bartmani]